MAICSSALAWEIPRQRRLAGYNPWGGKESETTERPSTQKRRDHKVHRSGHYSHSFTQLNISPTFTLSRLWIGCQALGTASARVLQELTTQGVHT